MPIKKFFGVLVFDLRQIFLGLAAAKFYAICVCLFFRFCPGLVFSGAAKIDNLSHGYFAVLAQDKGGCLGLSNRKSSNSPA